MPHGPKRCSEGASVIEEVWSCEQGNEAGVNTTYVKLTESGKIANGGHAAMEFIGKIENPMQAKMASANKLLKSMAATRMKGVGNADQKLGTLENQLTSVLREGMLSFKGQPDILQAKTAETSRLWGIDYDPSDLHDLHAPPYVAGSLLPCPCDSSHAAIVYGTEAQRWNVHTDIGLVASNATIPNAALPNSALLNSALPAGYGKGLADCGHLSSGSFMPAMLGGGCSSNNVATTDLGPDLFSAFCCNDFKDMLRMLDDSEEEAASGNAGASYQTGSATLCQDNMKHQRSGNLRDAEASGLQDSDADTSDELLVMNSDELEMACDLLEMKSDLLESPSYWPAHNAPLLITGLRLDADNAAYIDASTSANTVSIPAANMAAASFSAPLMKLQALMCCDGGKIGSKDESSSLMFQKWKRERAASDDPVDPSLTLDGPEQLLLSAPQLNLMAAPAHPQGAMAREIRRSGSEALAGAVLHGQPSTGMCRVLSCSVAELSEMNRTTLCWDPHTSTGTNLGAMADGSHSAPLPLFEARTKPAGTRKRRPMQSTVDMDPRLLKIGPHRQDSFSGAISGGEAMYPRAFKEEKVESDGVCDLGQMAVYDICKRSKGAAPITKALLSGLYLQSMKDAAVALGIGSTAMKDLCRKFNIARWPFRKLVSLDGLIKTMYDTGASDPGALEILDYLKRLKATIMKEPNTEIPEDVRDLRQTNFKIRYKEKKSAK